MNLPPLPFSYEALVLVTNMYAMWLTAPTLNMPQYSRSFRWWIVWGTVVFYVSLGMMFGNFYLWFRLKGWL